MAHAAVGCATRKRERGKAEEDRGGCRNNSRASDQSLVPSLCQCSLTNNAVADRGIGIEMQTSQDQVQLRYRCIAGEDIARPLVHCYATYHYDVAPHIPLLSDVDRKWRVGD